MNSKIFLLITDDPDDCVDFSAVLDELSPDAVVVTICDCQKAKRLLEESIFVPHCVLINITMDGEAGQILNTLRNGAAYGATARLVYGGDGINQEAANNGKHTDFIDNSPPYTELRKRLMEILQE